MTEGKQELEAQCRQTAEAIWEATQIIVAEGRLDKERWIYAATKVIGNRIRQRESELQRSLDRDVELLDRASRKIASLQEQIAAQPPSNPVQPTAPPHELYMPTMDEAHRFIESNPVTTSEILAEVLDKQWHVRAAAPEGSTPKSFLESEWGGDNELPAQAAGSTRQAHEWEPHFDKGKCACGFPEGAYCWKGEWEIHVASLRGKG